MFRYTYGYRVVLVFELMLYSHCYSSVNLTQQVLVYNGITSLRQIQTT
mgnify:CR=1 FL=1